MIKILLLFGATMMGGCDAVQAPPGPSVLHQYRHCEELDFGRVSAETRAIAENFGLAHAARRDSSQAFVIEMRDEDRMHHVGYMMGYLSVALFLSPEDTPTEADRAIFERILSLFPRCELIEQPISRASPAPASRGTR